MKISQLFFILVLSVLTIEMQGQFQSANYDKNCADYWLHKMSDPNVNYNDLVREFDTYWEGKTPDKNSGYKLFKRWQYAMLPHVRQDGFFNPPDHDMNEYNKFIQQNPGDNIVGTWELVGPTQFPDQNFGVQCPGLGRISALAFHPTNPDILFAGAPVGGLWKSVDGGDNWTNLNTDNINTLGVSDIAIDYTNPNIIYFGSGDRDGWETWGLGVYKSVDGGLNWTKYNTGMGNKTVCKLLISPDNPSFLLAAVSDGIYRTYNGGLVWQKQLTTAKAVKELVYKPGDPDIIYATSAGTIYRSVNYSSTWSAVLSTDAHRIVLAVTPDLPDRVYAIATKDSKIYKVYVSNDSGNTFTDVNGFYANITDTQGGFNLDIAVDPNDANTLYLGMVNVFKSTNGGSTWTKILTGGSIHADQHLLEVSPYTDDYLYVGNDGGIYKMWIGGGTHYATPISDGLAITQIYRMSTYKNNPDLMIFGTYHCGSYVTDGVSWEHRIQGDGLNCQIDPFNPSFMYGTVQNGVILRSSNGGVDFYTIAQNGVNGINQPGGWYSPFILDETNPARMLCGFQDVWRSDNVNTSGYNDVTWTNISSGQLSGNVIDLIEQSPVNPNRVFVADAGGNRIFMTLNAWDATPSWTELPKPYNHIVTCIEAHPSDPDIVYFTITDVIYKYKISTNTWTDMTGNFPGFAKLCIVYQKNSNEGLYVGTVVGVFYKDADMPDWVIYKSELPKTKVYELEINYHTNPAQLFASTFGRSIWKTDIFPSSLPDLALTGGSSQVNGTQVKVIAGYQNQSPIAYTDPFHVGFYLSTDNVISTGDILFSQESKPAIAPWIIDQGNSQWVDVALINPEIPSGTYYMGAIIDNLSEVMEINELNNTFLGSNQVTIPNPPDPPTNVLASDGTYSDRIFISWSPPPNGPWLYGIYRSTENNSATAVKISGENWIQNNYYDDFDAPKGINVYYWIKASGYEQGLRPSGFSPSNEGWRPVAPPTNVQASDGLYNNKIAVTWEPPDNATHYKVFRNTVNNSGSAVSISGTDWISSTFYYDQTAVTGTTYYYWVKAARSVSGSRSSDYSEVNTGWVAFASAPELTASDGTYTDHVELNWTSIAGANYYKVFWSLTNDPETSTACTGWQTQTALNYNTGMPGTIVYFWVKASADQLGNVSTGYSTAETGWMNFIPPANVQATDGTMLEAVNITWNYVSGGSYYQVYRALNSGVWGAFPISNWFYGNHFLDTTGTPGRSHYYWVRVAIDTVAAISNLSAYDVGWGLLDAPTVSATKGFYSDKVDVSWQPVNGGIAYRVFRSEAGNPDIDTLTDWSTSTIYFYKDLTPVTGTYYNYYVKAARSTTGLRESEPGIDIGYADECGNMKEDIAYRNTNFHGSTLEITQRVYNEGPFPFTNPSQVAYTLDAEPFDGSPEYIIAYADIPPLNVNEFFDIQVAINLDTIQYGPIPFGTWYIGCFMSWDWNNCETNFDDDYVTWSDEPFVFTDAMHDIYTIGPVSGDFYSVEKAILALEERGMSDPVTFYLEPTVHFEQNTFGPVTGSEYARPITFQTDPAFSDTAEIVFAPTVENNYTLRFSNAANIHFKNLKLSTTGFSNFQSTYGCVIEFAGSCDNIHIENCLITGFSDDYHLSDDNVAIYCSNSNSSRISLFNNTIRYGFKGIYLEGMNLALAPLTEIEIRQNTIEGFICTGIELKNIANPIVTGNMITAPPTQTSFHYGIDIDFSKGGCDISGNRITLYHGYQAMFGISLTDFNLTDPEQALIANNFIMLHSNATFDYGIIATNFNKTHFYHNSIHLSGNSGTFNSCMLLDCTMPYSGGYDNSMINNILSNQLGGYCLVYNENAYLYQLLVNSDYNDFFSSGPDLFYCKNSYSLQTINQWWGETGFDQNSLNVNPIFASDFDLHSNSPDLDGAAFPLAEVNSDIDDEQRDPVHPDIGADEYTSTLREISLRVFLEGPFEGGEMTTDLMDGGLIPLIQPYNPSLPYYDEDNPVWLYSGTEAVPSIPIDVVDWVIVQFRDAEAPLNATSATIIDEQVAFLLKDGTVVGLNGTDLLQLQVTPVKNLYVVIFHRNHLGIISANPLIESGGTYNYDFTTGASQALGGANGHKEIEPGIWGMVAGDGNGNGLIQNTDETAVWKSDLGQSGYKGGDFNLNGLVQNTDETNYWKVNLGAGGQTPGKFNQAGYQSQVPK
jgi:hypothetical protein